MKILLCSIGSRGDIQPILILGDYFSKHGHDVRVASANIYTEMAQNYAVDYHAFEGDYGSIVDDDEMKKMVGKNPMTMRKNLAEKVYPIIQNSIQKFYELSSWADVIIYHPKTLVDCFGKDIQHKLIKAYVVPAFTPTKAFRNPIIQFLALPKFLNKFSYRLVMAMMGTVKTPINNFRKENKIEKGPLFLKTPILYGISNKILKKPDDYPTDHLYTGFWQKKTENQKLEDKIIEFVSGEKEVLLITFGSMPYKSSTAIQDHIDAIRKQHDVKILVVKAWGLKDAIINQNEDTLAIDRAPFDLLFPKVDYVMHHGGAGTSAIAIKAGLPQFICPVLHPFGDQYFWGKILEDKKVAVAPIPLKKLNTKNLASSISNLISTELKENAKLLAAEVSTEDGLAEALAFVEKHAGRNEN